MYVVLVDFEASRRGYAHIRWAVAVPRPSQQAGMSIALVSCLLTQPSRINARRKYLSKRLQIDSSVVNCLLSLPSQMSISFRVAPIALSGVRDVCFIFYKVLRVRSLMFGIVFRDGEKSKFNKNV